MKKLVGAACALVLGLIATPASAAIVFNNGPAIAGAGGPDLVWFEAADDFVLAQSTIIRGGSFTYSGTGDQTSPGVVSYAVYANRQDPGPARPGDLLASGVLDITSIDTLTYEGNYGSRRRANFLLQNPFGASAGVRYWFSLSSQSPEDVRWSGSNFHSPTGTWTHHRFDPPGHWRSDDYELAFTLTAGVPEPATWAMMVVGFGLIGGTLRGRVGRASLA